MCPRTYFLGSTVRRKSSLYNTLCTELSVRDILSRQILSRPRPPGRLKTGGPPTDSRPWSRQAQDRGPPAGSRPAPHRQIPALGQDSLKTDAPPTDSRPGGSGGRTVVPREISYGRYFSGDMSWDIFFEKYLLLKMFLLRAFSPEDTSHGMTYLPSYLGSPCNSLFPQQSYYV